MASIYGGNADGSTEGYKVKRSDMMDVFNVCYEDCRQCCCCLNKTVNLNKQIG